MGSDKKSILKQLITGPTQGYGTTRPDREMWKDVAKAVGGEFKLVFTKSRDIEIHRITVPHKKWELEISVSESRPMKVKAYFEFSQELEMIITWEDILDRFFKRFRKPEVQLGWKEFDRTYLIKTDRSDLVKEIISSDIQKSLLKYNIYSITYLSNIEKREAELISVISRFAGDRESNIELIDLFKLLIDKLDAARVIR
jgi:hypothetical protein